MNRDVYQFECVCGSRVQLTLDQPCPDCGRVWEAQNALGERPKMTSSELLKTLLESIEAIRSDFREDLKAHDQKMEGHFDSIHGDIKELDEKVRIQNGRVGKLEDAKGEDSPSWWQSIVRQKWFPFLAAFLAAEIGGKTLGDLFSAALAMFKPH